MLKWIAYRPVPKLRPIICLGGRLVLFSGKWADIRLRKGWLVVSWRKNNRHIYYSTDGTPRGAKWRVGHFFD